MGLWAFSSEEKARFCSTCRLRARGGENERVRSAPRRAAPRRPVFAACSASSIRFQRNNPIHVPFTSCSPHNGMRSRNFEQRQRHRACRGISRPDAGRRAGYARAQVRSFGQVAALFAPRFHSPSDGSSLSSQRRAGLSAIDFDRSSAAQNL
jgi:hypothetical protein